jgi:hypothetical protein
LIFNQAGENQVSAASLRFIQVGKSRYQVAGFATRAAQIGQRLRATFDKNSEIKDCRDSLGFCRKEIKEIKQIQTRKTSPTALHRFAHEKRNFAKRTYGWRKIQPTELLTAWSPGNARDAKNRRACRHSCVSSDVGRRKLADPAHLRLSGKDV